ncbi:MAG: FAD-dependent oxidoreductase, partial [Paracoccaceae bacterium]
MNDFLVIGGGIAGISAAARLSKLGSVTLLEAEAQTGFHSSGRSAAMFEETYGSPSTVALNASSRRYLETANGGVLSPRGLMLIGTDQTGAAFAHD